MKFTASKTTGGPYFCCLAVSVALVSLYDQRGRGNTVCTQMFILWIKPHVVAGDWAEWPRWSHLTFCLPPTSRSTRWWQYRQGKRSVERDHESKQFSIQNLILDSRSLLQSCFEPAASWNYAIKARHNR